jgi:ElaA protein
MKIQVKSFDELSGREVYEILRAREEIFTHEKGMVCHDIDGDDYNCLHILLTEDKNLKAYLRVLGLGSDAVKIGRVLSLTHGKGHGRALMSGAISALREKGYKKILVHAQCDAVAYYEKMGFIKTSSEYLEEGVPHISMELEIL